MDRWRREPTVLALGASYVALAAFFALLYGPVAAVAVAGMTLMLLFAGAVAWASGELRNRRQKRDI